MRASWQSLEGTIDAVGDGEETSETDGGNVDGGDEEEDDVAKAVALTWVCNQHVTA